ncbi:MAG TPA: hypothetical protein PLI57_07395 [Spirochaetota bacterium]|nr:hypothetical protein [Spirochaetota bacterium]
MRQTKNAYVSIHLLHMCHFSAGSSPRRYAAHMCQFLCDNCRALRRDAAACVNLFSPPPKNRFPTLRKYSIEKLSGNR